MKTITLLTLLTLLLTSTTNAGLDTDAISDHVIGIYHFESTKQRKNGSLYTPDSGIRKINGNLQKNANLTNAGKYGNSLLLRSQDAFCASTLSSEVPPFIQTTISQI